MGNSSGALEGSSVVMSRSTAYEREPCPVRVMGDVGGGFGIGIIGGTIWHSIKGAKQAPKGEKWMGMLFNVAKRAPRTGLAFASWGGSFSILDCVISQFIRRKEDIWSPIMAGTIVGASACRPTRPQCHDPGRDW